MKIVGQDATDCLDLTPYIEVKEQKSKQPLAKGGKNEGFEKAIF